MGNLSAEAGHPFGTAGELLARHQDFSDPYPLLGWLRDNEPVAPAGDMRFVTRYDDVVAVYRDERFSRARQAEAEINANTGDIGNDQDLENARRAFTSMLIHMDEPDHRRMRNILEGAFKPSSVVAWIPRVKAITHELIDRVRDKPRFDVLKDLAFPLPEKVMCELMGVPHEDHALWGAWTDAIVRAPRTYAPSAEQIAKIRDAQRNFYYYFRDLVRQRSKNLSDDLVSVLIRAENEGDKLSELEVLGTLQLLIMAGHETTASLVVNGTYLLLKHPDQYRLLREDPELVRAAVEEMLRYESPSHWSLPREALVDVPMGDDVIPAGAPVVAALNSANRDPTRFAQADRFDITRKNNFHIAFAAGPHFCLGNQLARQEACIMFKAMVTRLPELHLAEEPELKDSFVRSYESLIVTQG